MANAEIKYINLIMGIERFIATKYPFRYKHLCTKSKIFGSFAFVSFLIIVSRACVYLLNEIKYVPCINVYGKELRLYSDKFRYKTKCYKNEVLPFAASWYDIYEYWFEGIFLHALPLIALIIISIVSIIALCKQRNDQALQLSETVRFERQSKDNQMTKLVRALILNGIATSLFTIPTIIVMANDCIYTGLYACICLEFLMNPIIYYIFSNVLREKVKVLLQCVRK